MNMEKVVYLSFVILCWSITIVSFYLMYAYPSETFGSMFLGITAGMGGWIIFTNEFSNRGDKSD